ncbi:MAG: energy-coupling factor transporter transmembrane protein EcfT [Lachnospiraceae bacterium]|nr:energy-coupling factor transporter transmembrane protein EcfT [Lachnospiraceae bacterium]
MFRELTIGQYYPGESVIHRLDPRVKLMGALLFIVSVFLASNIFSILVVTAFLVMIIVLCKVPLSFMLKGLKSIVLLLVIAGIFNLFLTPGTVLVQFWFLHITDVGIKNCIFMIIRMTYLIVGTSVMTLTTTPNGLTDGLEKSLGFLNKIKIPVHEIAMMMSIALRFTPILVEETDKIMKAQMARGADFESGGVFKRAKSMVPILVPLFVSAFRRANDLALAMEARCYNGGDGRTKMKPLQYNQSDKKAYAMEVCFVILTIVANVLYNRYVSGLFANMLGM